MTTKTRVPASVVDRFHSYLMEDDGFNEAMMRVAMDVARYYQGGTEPLDEDSMDLAMELCTRVSVA